MPAEKASIRRHAELNREALEQTERFVSAANQAVRAFEDVVSIAKEVPAIISRYPGGTVVLLLLSAAYFAQQPPRAPGASRGPHLDSTPEPEEDFWNDNPFAN